MPDTCAQARKLGEIVDLCESFMATLDEGEPSSLFPATECEKVNCVNESDLFPADKDLSLNVTRDILIDAQRNDPSLTSCLSSVVAAEEDSKPCVFFLDNGVLMRRWSPDSSEIRVVNQVVVPTDYRAQILSLAHDSSLAGHLGVKKMYHRVLRNFFWFFSLFLAFWLLSLASLTLNLAKCEFGKATVTYLGKQVGQGEVRPLAEKVQAIIDFPVPQSKKALRRFLGMCGYYRGFCQNFSDVVAPLTGLVSPLKMFVWSPACQAPFVSAKALLCSAPVLYNLIPRIATRGSLINSTSILY